MDGFGTCFEIELTGFVDGLDVAKKGDGSTKAGGAWWWPEWR